MDLDRLNDKFPSRDIEWRVQRGWLNNTNNPVAIVIPYVTNRAIQQRLDDVCGQAFWRNEFKSGPNGGVICGLSIKIENDWLTKWDGADNTAIEAVKGGLSGAMKRAGIQWGIGRYLYDLDEGFANFCASGKKFAKINEVNYKWNPPKLPLWALPLPEKTKSQIKSDFSKPVDELFRFNESNDEDGIREVWEELDDTEKQIVWKLIPEDIHDTIKKLIGAE